MAGENKEPGAVELARTLSTFIRDADSLAETLPAITSVLTTSRTQAEEVFQKFVNTKCKILRTEGKSVNYSVPFELMSEHQSAARNAQRAQVAHAIVARSFLVSLVSQFDVFIAGAMSQALLIRPEILNSIDRTITLSKLLKFPSIEKAAESLVEKEVESVMRKSHADHFEWLERVLGIPLRTGLDVWPEFIEITERRNLFVHNNGLVSSQYLEVCKLHKVPLPQDTTERTQLDISSEYFQGAVSCLLELAIKLTHVIWRKLVPSDRKNADAHLNMCIFDFLCSEHFARAEKIAEFATAAIKQHVDEEHRLRFVVNLAIAKKFGGKSKDTLQLIASEDWSATSDLFKLAVSVLKDDFDPACKLMQKIGPKGGIGKREYKEWPLFREFRKREDFQTTYRAIFGEAFPPSTTSKTA